MFIIFLNFFLKGAYFPQNHPSPHMMSKVSGKRAEQERRVKERNHYKENIMSKYDSDKHFPHSRETKKIYEKLLFFNDISLILFDI